MRVVLSTKPPRSKRNPLLAGSQQAKTNGMTPINYPLGFKPGLLPIAPASLLRLRSILKSVATSQGRCRHRCAAGRESAACGAWPRRGHRWTQCNRSPNNCVYMVQCLWSPGGGGDRNHWSWDHIKGCLFEGTPLNTTKKKGDRASKQKSASMYMACCDSEAQSEPGLTSLKFSELGAWP